MYLLSTNDRIKLLRITFILRLFWISPIFTFFRAFFPFILSPLRTVRASTCSVIPHGAPPLGTGPPFFSCCASLSLKKANPRGQAWTWISLLASAFLLHKGHWNLFCLHNSYFCLLSCFHFPLGRKKLFSPGFMRKNEEYSSISNSWEADLGVFQASSKRWSWQRS